MDRFHPQIAARVFNTPLFIHPGKLDAIVGALYRQWGVDNYTPSAYTTAQGERREPGYRVVNGVAVIDVFGVLAHRSGISADSTFILGYQTIARRLEASIKDPGVSGIVLDMDSPGGEVAGAFELAEQVRAATATKPVYAVVDSLCASACYLIGSAANEISISRTGYAGSIGVVWRHADFSRHFNDAGITVTHLYAGKHKVDGNPYEPLAEDVRADFQKEIDKLYEMFVSAVSTNRNMKAQAVRDTEARLYLADEAVSIGLADRIETADALLSRLTSSISGAGSRQLTSTTGGTTMSKETQSQNGSGPEQPATTVIDQQALDAARAAGKTEGMKEGRTAERTRIGAILQSEEAKGRSDLAMHLACETDVDADAAKAVLSKSPQSMNTISKLDAAMAGTAQPGIGPDGQAADANEEQERKALVSAIAAGAQH